MDALVKFGEKKLEEARVWREEAGVAYKSPRATLTPLSCSPNFSRASITRYTHANHEPILN